MVANANMFTAGDEIWIEKRSEADSSTDHHLCVSYEFDKVFDENIDIFKKESSEWTVFLNYTNFIVRVQDFCCGFIKIFQNMNKYNIRTSVPLIDDVQKLQLELEKLAKENNNLCKIISIIHDQYIVQTPKWLINCRFLVLIKNVRDEIKIERL